jgi:hypothetical protein
MVERVDDFLYAGTGGQASRRPRRVGERTTRRHRIHLISVTPGILETLRSDGSRYS